MLVRRVVEGLEVVNTGCGGQKGLSCEEKLGRGWQISKGGNNGDRLCNSSNWGGSITGGSETNKRAPQGGKIGTDVALYTNQIMKNPCVRVFMEEGSTPLCPF